MKYKIAILLVGLFYTTSYSQIINDTIYIKFKPNIDSIKEFKNNKTIILLKNELYQKEMLSYKKDWRKFKQDTLLPPTTFVPVKPVEFYEYFLTEKVKECPTFLNAILKENEEIYYDRYKLKSLSPYKKLIFIIKETKDYKKCFPVSFYPNTQE